jgi:transcriptional regulator with XRE-family HTH domain
MTRQGGWPASGFGERLKALREQAGVSQAQLAERADCHILTISKIERGLHEPAWPLVRALCKALGVACTAFEGTGEAGGSARKPRGPGGPKKAADATAPKKTARRKKT